MMKKRLFLMRVSWTVCVLSLLIPSCGGVSEQAGPSVPSPLAKREALPIDASAKMSQSHPEYQPDMTCAECHLTKCDTVTSATTLYLNNFKTLGQDELWKRIEAFLPGRERFVMATSYHNAPVATTIDFVLDPVEKVSYAVCEKGTQKLEQIKKNPVVSMVHFEGWTVAQGGSKQWKSVQIEGRAEVVLSSDPRFEAYLDKYQLVRLSKERAKKRMDMIRVPIDKVIFFDSTLLPSGFAIYQKWERGHTS